MRTNIITSVEVTDAKVNDMRMFETLVKDTAGKFKMSELSADKGYLSDENYETGSAHADQVYIAFKSNNKMERAHLHPESWQKMLGHFYLKRGDFLKHYHKRSNVESTMWMLKSKFGTRVRAKHPVAQENEILCMVLCHNIAVLIGAIYELGLEVEFWKSSEAA